MVEIIAEIGSNHGGDFARAVQHIEAAKECGATGVKFQLFRAVTLDSRPAMQAALKPYELPWGWLSDLRDRAHTLGLTCIVTPFDPDLALSLKGLVDLVKVSAYDLTYEPLLEAVAGLGVPVILSTAMATVEEVRGAYIWVRRQQVLNNYHFMDLWLLHGVAAYPCSPLDMNLKAIGTLQAEFPDVGVGLSDHSLGAEAAVLAVSQGAQLIEKHFRCRGVAESSPDYGVSATEEEFAGMVLRVRQAEALLGDGLKRGPLPVELPLFETCRRSREKPLRG